MKELGPFKFKLKKGLSCPFQSTGITKVKSRHLFDPYFLHLLAKMAPSSCCNLRMYTFYWKFPIYQMSPKYIITCSSSSLFIIVTCAFTAATTKFTNKF